VNATPPGRAVGILVPGQWGVGRAVILDYPRGFSPDAIERELPSPASARAALAGHDAALEAMLAARRRDFTPLATTEDGGAELLDRRIDGGAVAWDRGDALGHQVADVGARQGRAEGHHGRQGQEHVAEMVGAGQEDPRTARTWTIRTPARDRLDRIAARHARLLLVARARWQAMPGHGACRVTDHVRRRYVSWRAIAMMRHGFGGRPYGADTGIQHERHTGRVGGYPPPEKVGQ